MLDRVAGTIIRYNMLPGPCRLGVAVSGGADSVFLLHALAVLTGRFPLELSVVHLNHGLRGRDSDADLLFVETLANQLTLPFHSQRVHLPDFDRNLEQAGRKARRAFFGELISRGAVDKVATGHTRSDQAETVLFRLLRGAGSSGLRGILPVIAPGLIRPLLECDRSEIESWLTQRGIRWREDATNQDRRFARNRIRHEVLPLLARAANPAVVQALAQTADIAREENELLESYVDAAEDMVLKRDVNAMILSCEGLGRLHPAIARRVIRRACRRIQRGGELGWAHVDEIFSLSRAESGGGTVQAPGVEAIRSFGQIRLSRREPPCGFDREVCPPQAAVLPGGQEICLEVIDRANVSGLESSYNKTVSLIDYELVPGHLRLRNWLPGDRLEQPGRTIKLKIWFQEAQVPAWERASWPVLVSSGELIWASGLGAAAKFTPGSNTRKWLRITEIRKSGGR